MLHSDVVGRNHRTIVGGARSFPPSGAEHSSDGPPRGGGGAESPRQGPPRPHVARRRRRRRRLLRPRHLRSKLRWVRTGNPLKFFFKMHLLYV